jgi:hypothetical protein
MRETRSKGGIERCAPGPWCSIDAVSESFWTRFERFSPFFISENNFHCLGRVPSLYRAQVDDASKLLTDSSLIRAAI